MAHDLLKDGEGRFFRGNLHCHSNRSDGLLDPEDVLGAYREAGYDFLPATTFSASPTTSKRSTAGK